MVIQEKHVTMSNDGTTLIIEHSDVPGLRNLGFPLTIPVQWNGMLRGFQRSHPDMNGDDVAGMNYKEVGGSLRLLIIND